MALRRPLCVAGFSAFAGTLLAAQAGPGLSQQLAVAAGACGSLALLAALFRRITCQKGPLWALAAKAIPPVAVASLTLSLALALYVAGWYAQVEPFQALDGVKAVVQVQLTDYPEERYHRFYYPGRVIWVEGYQVEPFHIRLSCSEPLACRPYDVAETQVVFYRFSAGGLFSQENAQLADGHVLGAYLADFDPPCAPYIIWPPGRILAEIRQAVSRGIARYLPGDEAGLVQASLLGQRAGLSDACYDDFVQTGSAHLMAVSGLHMTALALLTGLMVNKLPLGRWGRALANMAALLAYLCIIGFPLSAFRSCAMFFFLLLGQALGRKADSLNSLGGGVLAICLARPFSGGDVGFCLSVTATAGIITLYGPLSALFTRLLRPLPAGLRRPACGALALSMAASAFSLPIQVAVFGGISLLNPLATLLLTPVVTAMLYVSLPLAALAPFPLTQSLARPFAFCAGWLARLAMGMADKLASIPGGYFSFRHSIWPITLGVCLLCLLVLLLYRVKYKVMLATALTLLLLAGIGASSTLALSRETITLAVTGEGSSLCVLVLQDGRAAALSLGGFNSGVARRVLRDHNIATLHTAFLPQQDLYAREMAVSLLGSVPVETLLLPQGAYAGKDLQKPGVPIRYVASGQRWQALPTLPAHFLADTGQVLFRANGLWVAVETSAAGTGAYDLRITGQKDLQLPAGLTVLLDPDQAGWEEIFRDARPGSYLPVDGQEVLYLYIHPDGSLSFEMGD